MPKVVIVGAGISGLALAYRLQAAAPHVEISILEERPRPGGVIWTERHEGFQVEFGPNGFLDNRPSTLRLCQDLGLGERLIAASEAARKYRYLFLNGKLQMLPSSAPGLVTSPVLSWRAKAGLLMEPLRRRRRHGGDESIHAFFVRRLGREIAENLADAFVTGIFAGDPSLLSVRACLPRLVALEQEYGSVLRGLQAQARRRRRENAETTGPGARPTGSMWSFGSGLRLLIETLSSKLHRPPLLGVRVRRIAPAEHGWTVHADGHDAWSADAAVLTCPAYHQAALLAEVDSELAELVQGIAYNRIAVVALGYRAADMPFALNGFGFLTRQSERLDLLGAQWCSSIFPERAPDGMVLLRVLCGGWNRPEIAALDDEGLLSAVRHGLQLTMEIKAAPVFHRIVRWERALPQYLLGHPDRLAAIDRLLPKHPGLFLGGNAYRGVSMNDCTEQAELLAAKVRAYLVE